MCKLIHGHSKSGIVTSLKMSLGLFQLLNNTIFYSIKLINEIRTLMQMLIKPRFFKNQDCYLTETYSKLQKQISHPKTILSKLYISQYNTIYIYVN